ncbi:helix-turn-helix domain-containing protein [Brachybacterium paraconglomeratum]|uniref:helix-turn-helix domain-containing protein n=1 Tax=Brachybacterium paraconglomeratum TaxID=173362 RepID=UPI003FD381CB
MSKQESPNEIVGARVRELRQERGWSAEELAERLGDALGKTVQHYIVNRIENGARPTTADEIGALSDIFDIKPGRLFEVRSDVQARELEVRKLEHQNLANITRLKGVAEEILSINDREKELLSGPIGEQVKEANPWLGLPVNPLGVVKNTIDEHEVISTMRGYGAEEVLKSLKARPPEYPF